MENNAQTALDKSIMILFLRLVICIYFESAAHSSEVSFTPVP